MLLDCTSFEGQNRQQIESCYQNLMLSIGPNSTYPGLRS